MAKHYFLDLTGQSKHSAKGEIHEILFKNFKPKNLYICYEWGILLPIKTL